jgi:hypothetical protein
MAREVDDVKPHHRRAAALRAAFAFAFAFALVGLVPSRALASGCREVSDIVGEQHCNRYGSLWSLEQTVPMIFRFGMRYSQLSTADTTFTEQTAKQSRPDGYRAYRYPGEALGVKSLSGLGVDGGVGFFLYGQLYSGFEGSLTFGSASTASFTTASGVKLGQDSGLNVTIVHGGVPIGYRIPLGRAALRGEVMLGIAQTTVDHHVDAPGLPSTGSADETRGLVEPRIAAEIWFTQHIAFSVYGGTNVLDTDGRSRAFGISLAWHIRSFDGDTSF